MELRTLTEQSVIGSLLLRSRLYFENDRKLKLYLFQSDEAQAAYKGVIEQYEKGNEIDLYLFANAYGVSRAWVSKACDLAKPTEFEVQLQALIDEHFTGKLVTELELTSVALSSGANHESLAVDLIKNFENILNKTEDKGLHVRNLYKSSMDMVLAAQEKKGLVGLDTGIEGVNEIIGGWHSTDSVVIAARPGMGKTTMLLYTALINAKMGVPVLLFSIEMASEQLISVLASLETGISLFKMRQGGMTEYEKQSYMSAVMKIADLPIFIDEDSRYIEDIIAKTYLYKRKHDIGLVGVDYLQLVLTIGQKFKSRNYELDYITREIKNLAKKTKVPIISLAQLSREIEKRASKKPVLADLKDSGGIEQDADIVIMPYRDNYYNLDGQDHTQIFINKHRQGALGEVRVEFKGGKYIPAQAEIEYITF